VKACAAKNRLNELLAASGRWSDCESRIPALKAGEIHPFNHPRREDTSRSATLQKTIVKFFETWNELINEM
jgi:hypothetical protein